MRAAGVTDAAPNCIRGPGGAGVILLRLETITMAAADHDGHCLHVLI